MKDRREELRAEYLNISGGNNGEPSGGNLPIGIFPYRPAAKSLTEKQKVQNAPYRHGGKKC